MKGPYRRGKSACYARYARVKIERNCKVMRDGIVHQDCSDLIPPVTSVAMTLLSSQRQGKDGYTGTVDSMAADLAAVVRDDIRRGPPAGDK